MFHLVSLQHMTKKIWQFTQHGAWNLTYYSSRYSFYPWSWYIYFIFHVNWWLFAPPSIHAFVLVWALGEKQSHNYTLVHTFYFFWTPTRIEDIGWNIRRNLSICSCINLLFFNTGKTSIQLWLLYHAVIIMTAYSYFSIRLLRQLAILRAIHENFLSIKKSIHFNRITNLHLIPEILLTKGTRMNRWMWGKGLLAYFYFRENKWETCWYRGMNGLLQLLWKEHELQNLTVTSTV